MSKFSHTIINPVYLKKPTKQSNQKINILAFQNNTKKHVSTIFNYYKATDQSNKINGLCRRRRYQEKIKNIDVVNSKSGHTNIARNDKEEECDLLKNENITLMLKNAEEFIRNSLTRNQTKEIINNEANNKRKLQPEIQNTSNKQIKFSPTIAVVTSESKSISLEPQNNATAKQITNHKESCEKSQEMITKSSQISEMLKNAEVFIKNSLEFSACTAKNTTNLSEPFEKKMKNIPRNSSKGYIETRICQKIANSSLPVVNYSKLAAKHTFTIDLRLRK
jgi:hypothetical protein